MSLGSRTSNAMVWASAASVLPDTAAAVAEAAASVAATLGDGPVDLALVFFGASHVARLDDITRIIRERLDPRCVAGVSAHAVISSEHEIESGPGLTLIAARLPDVQVHPFVMPTEAWSGESDDPLEFARAAPGATGAELVIVLGDPFTFDAERALGAFNRWSPGTRVVGGLASAGIRPGTNVIVLNDWVATDGAVGLALTGALRVDVVVSQGCKPIGPPLSVTVAERNIVRELDGKPALVRVEEVLRALSEDDRQHLRNGLYVGRPVKPGASGQGDYLIRNLLGADSKSGALQIGDLVAEGERVRLHVRDATSAREDLELLLSPQVFDGRPSGALLFACNGRGRGLYGEPDRDIATLQGALGGNVAVAGMFCAGEIGPIGERNVLHGHTASIAIVRSTVRAAEPAA